MHGRKRDEFKALQRDAKTRAALQSKADKWFALMADVQQRRNNKDDADVVTTLTLLEKMLTVNPDPLDLWNQRRELLLMALEHFDVEAELRVTRAALQANPKAYGGWFHRKWSIRRYLLLQHQDDSMLAHEMDLTAQFLQRDERNFHCWNYRRFVVSCMMGALDGEWPTTTSAPFVNDGDEPGKTIVMGAQICPRDITNDTTDDAAMMPPPTKTAEQIVPILQSEFDFTTARIRDNFSNFSAFHYRSLLLPLLLAQSSDTTATTHLQAELQLLENAMFTEPDDQTSWWYHRFLLDYGASLCLRDKTATLAWQAVLTTHYESLQSLAEECATCKWVQLGLLHVLEAQWKLSSQIEDGHETFRGQRECILERLIAIDVDRKQRYEALLKTS